MRNSRLFGIAPLVLGSLVSINASALAVEGKFRGTYVCEKLPTTRDILRAPLDLIIKGDNIQFARPLYNLNGTRVVGTELAAGTVDGDGRLHLTSQWNLLGNTANGNYSGSLTKSGGTLTGTQTWTGPGGGRPWSELAPPPWCQHCSNDSLEKHERDANETRRWSLSLGTNLHHIMPEDCLCSGRNGSPSWAIT